VAFEAYLGAFLRGECRSRHEREGGGIWRGKKREKPSFRGSEGEGWGPTL